MVDPTGLSLRVDATDAEHYGEQGVAPEAPAAAIERQNQARIREEHSGFVGSLRAVAEPALSAGTFGLYDAFGRGVDGDDFGKHRREQEIAHPYLSAGGTGLGILAQTAVTGGLATAGRTVGGRVAGQVAEGALTGVGQTISERAISEDPADLEKLGASLSSNMLFGGLTNVGAHAAGKLVEKGLRRTGAAAEARAERLAKGGGANLELTEDLAEKVAKRDLPGLRAEAKVEDDALRTARATERDTLRKAEKAETEGLRDARTKETRDLREQETTEYDNLRLARSTETKTLRAEAKAEHEAIRAARAEKEEALSLAEREELARIEEDRVGMRALVAEEIGSLRATMKARKPWISMEGGLKKESAELREIGKVSMEADKAMDRLLRNPTALAEAPQRARGVLQQTEHALERLSKARSEIITGLEKQDARGGARELALEHVDDLLEKHRRLRGHLEDLMKPPESPALARVRRELADIKASAARPSSPVLDDITRRLDELASTTRPTSPALDAIRKRLDELATSRPTSPKLDDVRKQLEELGAAPITSARSDQIRSAIDAVKEGAPGPKGLGEQLVSGAAYSAAVGAVTPLLPEKLRVLAPILGGAAGMKVSGLLSGRITAAHSAAAVRTAKAIARVLERTGKVARVAIPVATKTLQSISYGDDEKPASGSLADLYKLREKQILSQTETGPDGKALMKPEARRAVAQRLAGLRAESPVAADRVETTAARRLEFLASKIPKRPDLGVSFGPSRWRASDHQIRTFARYAAAVEDPGGVEERLADGTVTPEDAEAYREVYPERFAAFKRELVLAVTGMKEPLPYERRLALSILTGIPLDPAMDPRVLKILQGQFTEEPGTEGGIQGPPASPEYGSIEKPQGTPAQERAG